MKIVLLDDHDNRMDEIEIDRRWVAEDAMLAARRVVHNS